MKTKTQLQDSFQAGDTPTQEDFYEWMDSYWHKDEKIPIDTTILSGYATNMDLYEKTKASIIKTISSVSTINTSAKDDSNIYGMNGKNMIIANGANAVTIQILVTAEPDFLSIISKNGTGDITFTAGAGVTIRQMVYTNIMHGTLGSVAKIERVIGTNTFNLYIRNYD